MGMLLRVMPTLIKKIEAKWGDELASEDLILSIDTNYSVRKVAFELVRSTKCLELSKGNCKVACSRLVNNYATHIASSLLKLKSKFHNSKLESIKKDLKSGRAENSYECRLKGNIITGTKKLRTK